MDYPTSRRRQFWLAGALLALLLAQVAVLTHDAAAAGHADDPLCQLCLAGHSVGAAATAVAAAPLSGLPTVQPPVRSVEPPVLLAAAPWQARAPPILP